MSAPAEIADVSALDRPAWELYSVCVHCGLCLQACPTYRALGTEMDSPRGRIYQIAQVEQGRLAVGESFVTHIDRCLGCRACETACPSGVQYGHVLERARTVIASEYRRGWLARKLHAWVFGSLLRDYKKLARAARRLALYQKYLRPIARASGALKLLGVEEVERLAPEIQEPFFFDEIGMMFPPAGEQRGRVAFLAGCVASVAFGDLNRATVRVLCQNGYEVLVPEGLRCCGALHAHAGYRETARHQARRNIDAMLDGRFDAIVTNAAGCGAMMKDYGELLREDPEYREKAKVFAAKVRDVTEFLAEAGLRNPAQKKVLRVTYQDPCHLAHAQKVRSAPRELMETIGVELVEMEHPDHCCGSAGTYNVVENELSMKILAAKMDDVQAAGGDVIATANVGCMIQLREGVRQRGMSTPVKHVIELIDEAYLGG